MISRRQIVCGAAAALGSRAAAQSGSYTRNWVTPPDWYWRAMRWLTMNLVQDDPGKFDPDFWLDYLKRAHVDAASWNSGGIKTYERQLPDGRGEAMEQRARVSEEASLRPYLTVNYFDSDRTCDKIWRFLSL